MATRDRLLGSQGSTSTGQACSQFLIVLTGIDPTRLAADSSALGDWEHVVVHEAFLEAIADAGHSEHAPKVGWDVQC